MSAAVEAKRCRRCGDPVPPAPYRGGEEKVYCTPKCGQAHRDSRKPAGRGLCAHCPHCQEKRAARQAWQAEAIAELREGRARLQAQFISFRAEVQALAEAWGLAGGSQGGA